MGAKFAKNPKVLTPITTKTLKSSRFLAWFTFLQYTLFLSNAFFEITNCKLHEMKKAAKARLNRTQNLLKVTYRLK